MFEKLLSKFKKDKKGGKAPAAKKPAASAAAKATEATAVANDDADTATQTEGVTQDNAAVEASPPEENGNGNGNGKPRVDVIDAMGNSVADMVTNIAEQLSASTEQLSKSRRYTNFAFTLLGVTLLSTGVYLTVMTLQLSSRLTQVDETLSMLTDQTHLVIAVEDLKILRQFGFCPVHTQQSMSKTVKSANPHRAGGHVEQTFRTRSQFCCGFIRESHRKDAVGRYVFDFD